MNHTSLKPLLITRETVQFLLGGISKTTFWRRRQKWEAQGTPFPSPVPGTNPIKGGEQYRYNEVMEFFKRVGIIDEY